MKSNLQDGGPAGERLTRQRRQRGLLFGEHRGNLPLDCAMDARVGPVGFPAIQIRLGLFEPLEAPSFKRRVFGAANAALHFPLAIRIGNSNLYSVFQKKT